MINFNTDDCRELCDGEVKLVNKNGREYLINKDRKLNLEKYHVYDEKDGIIFTECTDNKERLINKELTIWRYRPTGFCRNKNCVLFIEPDKNKTHIEILNNKLETLNRFNIEGEVVFVQKRKSYGGVEKFNLYIKAKVKDNKTELVTIEGDPTDDKIIASAVGIQVNKKTCEVKVCRATDIGIDRIVYMWDDE